ncbi:hypothetical protein GCM10027298_00710 [Epidermidibacterium keratini]
MRSRWLVVWALVSAVSAVVIPSLLFAMSASWNPVRLLRGAYDGSLVSDGGAWDWALSMFILGGWPFLLAAFVLLVAAKRRWTEERAEREWWDEHGDASINHHRP